SPLYARRGAHFDGKNTTFQVFAPYAKQVSVVLTAYGKEEHCIPMVKNIEGVWELKTEYAQPGRTYRYLVEDCRGNQILRTDPFGTSALECKGILESVVGPLEKYPWGDSVWMENRADSNPLEKPRVIYELHLESWKMHDGRRLGFRALAPALISYCKEMNYTHVELYDLLENPGGWGYKVRNYFTPNHRMGTPEDFKFFVDQLHQNGIHVIVDWIPTHYSYDSLSTTLHYFDGTDIFGWEKSDWVTYYFNFARPETRRMLKASARFWLEEMHVDGLRVDAVGPLVRRQGRDIPEAIAFLKDLNAMAHKKFPGIEMVAEDTDGFPNLTKPISEGGVGFDLQWNILWSKEARYFMQTPFHERRKDQNHRMKITDFLNRAKQGEKMIFSHSHDDSANRDTRWPRSAHADITLYKIECAEDKRMKFADLRNFFTWQFLSPHRGVLIHMGDELGQRRSWNTRVFEPDGAIEWQLLDAEGELDYPFHVGLKQCVSALGKLYRDHPSFWKKGEQSFKLICDHQINSIIAYQRHVEGEKGVIVVHNFSNGSWGSYDIPLFDVDDVEKLASLKEIFNSNAVVFGGTGTPENSSIEIIRDNENRPITMRIAIPPLTTMVFEENTILS
ncbi:hypothetical protein FJZ48_04405, partial [Candidatus Uhrbacteria bacterium]|nr:hypothetical protein [Candidatus Uhrbacteria bacterium]